MSTTDTAISTTAYTQIAGPGAVAATVTVTRPAQFAFSATAPAANFAGHHLDTNTSIPLAAMGSGIYMWVKAEYVNAFAVVTLGIDATISNGASGGGGGGGGDASAANQTAVQAVAGSDSSKAIAVQGITSGKAIPVSGTVAITNLDVALSTRLKPADTLTAVTTVGTITNPVTVTAGTNLNTSALALDASVNGIIVAQSSTTSGEKGPIVQAAVTTAAPTYTTGQTNPLSLDTAGNLRVNVVTGGAQGVAQGSTTSGQTGSLLQGAVTTSAPTYTTAQTNPLSLDTSGNLRVTGISTATVSQTGFKVSASYTRPSDTVQYAIGDAISASTSAGAQLTFSALGSANQYGVIERIEIISSVKGSTLPQILVYAFGNTLASATLNDNVALEIDNTTYALGGSTIPCVETSNTAARSKTMATGLNQPFKLDSSGNLYVALQALNTYTPASAEVLTVVINGVLR